MNGYVQRVLAAIQHQEPDRVPVDIGSTPSSGISPATAHGQPHAISRPGRHAHARSPTSCSRSPSPTTPSSTALALTPSISAVPLTWDEDWYDITLPTGLPVQFPTWFHAVPQEDGAGRLCSDGTRIATMSGASFFDQTCFPYVDGYPDNFDNLSQVMPLVHWSGLAHSPWDHAGEADFW